MFTIIYEKATGKVVNITSESNLDKVKDAIGESYDTMTVDNLPRVTPYRQIMRVVGGMLTVENKVLSVEEEKQVQIVETVIKINELKEKLEASDYKAIKFAEGVMSETEFAASRAERQLWRDQINVLEQKLKDLQNA